MSKDLNVLLDVVVSEVREVFRGFKSVYTFIEGRVVGDKLVVGVELRADRWDYDTEDAVDRWVSDSARVEVFGEPGYADLESAQALADEGNRAFNSAFVHVDGPLVFGIGVERVEERLVSVLGLSVKELDELIIFEPVFAREPVSHGGENAFPYFDASDFIVVVGE